MVQVHSDEMRFPVVTIVSSSLMMTAICSPLFVRCRSTQVYDEFLVDYC